jgi:hypothetical protein
LFPKNRFTETASEVSENGTLREAILKTIDHKRVSQERASEVVQSLAQGAHRHPFGYEAKIAGLAD